MMKDAVIVAVDVAVLPSVFLPFCSVRLGGNGFFPRPGHQCRGWLSLLK